jgi:hypothetical protein
VQAHRQHIESARQNVAAVEVSAQLAQRLSWNDARREYKLYLHSTLMDIHNGRAEARRDAWEQVCVCVCGNGATGVVAHSEGLGS